jgi:hypothetical protein
VFVKEAIHATIRDLLCLSFGIQSTTAAFLQSKIDISHGFFINASYYVRPVVIPPHRLELNISRRKYVFLRSQQLLRFSRMAATNPEGDVDAQDMMLIRSGKATTSRICPDSMNISRCDRWEIKRGLGKRFPPRDSQGLR